MPWWLWLIIIYYAGPSLILSLRGMYQENSYSSDDHLWGTPLWIYEENEDLNWFGVVLISLLFFIVLPWVYLFYILVFIFTVGRK